MSDKRTVKFDKEVPENAGRTAKRLFGQLKNQRGRLSIVAVCIVLYTVLNIFTPYYSAGVIDNLLGTIRNAMDTGAGFSIPWNPLGSKMLTLFLMYLLTGVFYHLQAYLMASVAERLILTLRKQISNKLNKLPLRFFDGNKPGEILSRVTSDLDKVSETLQTGLLKLLTAIGTLIGAMAFMFYYSPLLTVVFLVFAVVSLLVTKVVAKKNLECAADRQRALAYLTGIAEEYYTGRDVIRAYNHEQESIETINTAVDELRAATKKTDFLTNCVNPLIRLLSRLSQAVIMLLACHWMLQGRMSLGVVQAFFQYVNMASEPLTETSYMLNSLQSALASAERTFYFLDAKEEVPETALPAVLEKARGKISFENVSFGYSSDKILMKNISFTAKPGQKIAVVGSTGAGKTTLINLLMRFYEVNGGQITIDGIRTTDLTRKDLRHNFGMVLQDTWLFGGTIAENIAYGKPEATMEEIKAAARAAKVDYFIRTMPQGYDTVLDNDAANLSVGQRQLITIARVFLCNPPVIILDEATSSVDTRTEAEIGKAMKKLMSGRTSFVIAHRLSTIRDADNILFMENGNIIEQGNHKELLMRKGAYAALYYSQFA
jgi:ATP-binding cassette subfamily B multidrug efflux pump